MANTGKIENTYGNAMNVAIANTYAKNVLNASYLPKSSIIISTEYDTQDIGHAAMLVTDNNGVASEVSNYIIEKNGLHSSANSNVVTLNIDNKTLNATNNSLSIDIANFLDNSSLVENNGMQLDSQSLTKASKKSYGVAKVDNSTIKSDNGTLYVNTEKLDLASNSNEGIAKGDGFTISTNKGVLKANTYNLQKASNSTYGVARTDGNLVVSNDGVVSVNTSGFASIDNNGKRMHKADNLSILSNNGVLSVNSSELRKANETTTGIVNIDQNSISISNDDKIQIKDLSNFETFIYDYNEGMDEVEAKIAYIRSLLDNGNLVYNEPEIRHLTCNETTTTILAKPEYLEEPINMEIQHVYVSLNVITNCKFVVEVMYDNNIVPNVELESINYNDEFTISGIDCLEYVWPSTGMKEKNIILLFNSKNFLSSTMPSTDVTKLSIAVTAYDDNTKTKRVIYSIIRYNSFYSDEEIIAEPEQEFIEYSAEYVVDEKNSEWYIINVNPNSVEYWDRNEATFNPKADYVFKHGIIGESDTSSTIKVDQIQMVKNSEDYVLYLNGVYIHKATGKRFSFLKEIPVEYFDTATVDTGISALRGRGVYDYPYQVEFDTLYFQIRYQVDNSAKVCVSPSSKNKKIYTYHEISEKIGVYFRRNNINWSRNYISFDGESYYWSYCDSEDAAHPGTYSSDMKYIANTYLCIKGINTENPNNYVVLPANIGSDNVVKYSYNGNVYASIDLNNCYLYNELVDDQLTEFTSLQIDNNFTAYDVSGVAKLFFVIPISFANVQNYNDLEEFLYGENYASYLNLDVHNMKYDTNTYLFSDDEFTYGCNLPSIYCYSSFTYSVNGGIMKEVINNSVDLTYKLIDLYVEGNKINDEYFNPKTTTYFEQNDVEITSDMLDSDGKYTASISYNFSYGDGEQYWSPSKTSTFTKQAYSDPKFVINGMSLNSDNGLSITVSDLVYYAESFNNINGIYAHDTNGCASTLLLSYSYEYSHAQLQYPISLSSGTSLSVQIPQDYNNSSYSLNVAYLYKDNGEWVLDRTPSTQLGAHPNYTIAGVNDANKYVIAYISTTNASEIYSNVVCGIVPAFELAPFPIQNETTYFVDYDNSTIYGYSYVSNEVENYCVLIEDNGDNNYTYVRENTYFRITTSSDSLCKQNNITGFLNDSQVTTPNEITDNDMIIHIGGEFSSNGITYVSYVYNDTTAVFCLGTINETISHDLNTYVSAYITYHENNMYSCEKLTLANDNSTIVGTCNFEHILSEQTSKYLVVETSTYNNIIFNSEVYELYDIGEKRLAMSSNNSIQDDLRLAFNYMNGTVCEALNSGFRLYDANDPTNYCQLTNDNNNILYVSDGSLNNLTSDSLIYEMIELNQSIAYAYNIPNLKNLAQYCEVDVYSDYVVPRFNKKFDSYFNPYDFSVSASYGDTECLNTRLENATYVDFSIKYKDDNIFNTRINLQTPIADSQTSVINSYFVDNIEKASAKYSYSSTYEYAYWPINVTFDSSILDLYSNEEYNGHIFIDLSNLTNDVTILDNGKTINTLNAYVFNLENGICWNLDNYDENVNTYEFKLAINVENNYSIWPQLKSNYNMVTYLSNILYDLEPTGGPGSSD